MNDYVESALLNALIEAAKARDFDGINLVMIAINDYIYGCQDLMTNITTPEAKSNENSQDPQFEVKDTYTDTVLSFLEYYDCWEQFIKSNPMVYEDFTIEDYRVWLSKHYEKELKVLDSHVPNWIHSITHVFGQRYSIESNEYYKGIERLRKGHYKVKSNSFSPILRAI